MNQAYKLKFDEMRQNNLVEDQQTDSDTKLYQNVSNARNLTIVLADGKKVFLNYAYLISGELGIEGDQIVLTFTTHTVEFKGSKLDKLFEEFTGHLIKQVTCTDQRYNDILKRDETVINEVIIIKLE